MSVFITLSHDGLRENLPSSTGGPGCYGMVWAHFFVKVHLCYRTEWRAKPTAQTLIPHLEDLAVGRADLIPASLAPNSASLLKVPLHCTAMVRVTKSPVQYRTLVYALDYSGGSQRRQLRFQETRKETSVCYFPLLDIILKPNWELSVKEIQ